MLKDWDRQSGKTPSLLMPLPCSCGSNLETIPSVQAQLHLTGLTGSPMLIPGKIAKRAFLAKLWFSGIEEDRLKFREGPLNHHPSRKSTRLLATTSGFCSIG